MFPPSTDEVTIVIPDTRPTDVHTDASGVPLVVGLQSACARDARIVGEGAALLAAAHGLGLPVAQGVAVTIAGVAADDPMPALRHAWSRTRGRIRLALSDRGPQGGLSTSPGTYDATTVGGFLDGICDVLAHDLLENPGRRTGLWGLLVLRVPARARSVLVEAGPRRREVVVWTGADAPPLSGEHRTSLRALGRLTAARLGHPVSFEALDTGHGDWQIVDLRHREALPPVAS